MYLGLEFCRKGITGGWHTPADPVYDLKSYDYAEGVPTGAVCVQSTKVSYFTVAVK